LRSRRSSDETPIRVPRRLAVLCGLLFALFCATQPAHAQTPVAPPLLPTSVAYDAAGNLYFADTNRHQVYESSLGGALTIVAGNGTQGFSGDNGPATAAELNAPQGVAISPSGTLYIADTGNHRIRAVTAGIITTLAGNGTAGFSGDGAAATAATLANPTALAVNATGALLLCDTANQRIRQIRSGVITTLAGTGTQGFSGDNGPATAAALDTPTGIAVAPDGRIFLADTHNQRIRVIATDGTLTTFAGTGTPGYSGDNGPATSAALDSPRGLIVTSAGALLFADSNNQRIRMVNSSGTISTLAGTGTQGASTDASASTTVSLDTPRGIALSTFGSPVFADALNHLVREQLTNGTLYLPAGLAPARTSTVTLTTAASSTYGQSSATVTVSGTAGTPQGSVSLLDGTSTLAQATLASGQATFAALTLPPGTHSLSAIYLGDGVNPQATSSGTPITIQQATVTAAATSATIEYGQPIPPLTGTLTGVLPQDTGNLSALFTTAATPLSNPATYPITATLTGSASPNYALIRSPTSGSFTITKAASLTTEPSIAQNSYAGLPLFLSATAASTTQGTPTGTVVFTEGTTTVATATLSNGIASATYLSPSAGSHTITATYQGNLDFTPSTSPSITTTVSAMPDFTLALSGSGTQTVAPGDVASYSLTVGAQPAPFTGAVSLSVTGLPSGATASFSPPQVVPGTSTAAVTLSIQTLASQSAGFAPTHPRLLVTIVLIATFVLLRRRRTGLGPLSLLAILMLLATSAGCGSRSESVPALGGQTYPLTITGTSTNLAGAIVTHQTQVKLTMQ
jgi:hypothetical protein